MASKPCTNRRTTSSGAGDAAVESSNCFAAYEIDVAGILLHLPDLIDEPQLGSRFPTSWGAKRRRSAIDAPFFNASELSLVDARVEYVSSSPTSPLDFVDSKQAAPIEEFVAVGFKTRREGLLKDYERLSESRDQIKEEVKKMELSLDRLMAENQELQDVRKLCETSISPSMGLELSGSQPSDLALHQRPAEIPDLNFPAAEVYAGGLECPEASELENNHRIAAEANTRAEAAAMARQYRHLIQKSKRATRQNR